MDNTKIPGFFWGPRAGWTKYENNPVLGGELGTCFDLCIIKEGGIYRMWFSWRPKKKRCSYGKQGRHKLEQARDCFNCGQFF